MSSSSGSEKDHVEVLYKATADSSSEDPPRSQWSSLEEEVPEENPKKILHSQGLYSPGSGEICGKYLRQSDSSVFRHAYYNYPAVLDPGIEEALQLPIPPVTYAIDGQDRYLALCDEMNQCVVGIFHRGLLTPEIDLSYYGVNPQGVRAMALALQYNKTVQTLNLTDNFLTDDSCFHLGEMLIGNSTIKKLILSGCRVGTSGLKAMSNGLLLNRSLISLDLSRNQLGDEGMEQFAAQLTEGASIPQINLSYNSIGAKGLTAFTEALEYRNPFTHLDLSWNNLYMQGLTTKFLNELSPSTTLKKLNLAWNALDGERIAYALSSIIKIPTLKVLNLSNNKFHDTDTVTALISTLHLAKKLKTFDLSYNPFSPTDALLVLQKMLRPRVKIQNLLMENISVGMKFESVLENVRAMKQRANFHITYGGVVHNWTSGGGVDGREVVLRRAAFLGGKNKKRPINIPLYLLQLNKNIPKPIALKDLIERVSDDGMPLDEGLLTEFSVVFAGPKTAKNLKLIDLSLAAEFIRRLWPDTKLPPTPPPTPPPPPPPPPAPEPEPEKQEKKGKGKSKK